MEWLLLVGRSSWNWKYRESTSIECAQIQLNSDMNQSQVTTTYQNKIFVNKRLKNKKKIGDKKGGWI